MLTSRSAAPNMLDYAEAVGQWVWLAIRNKRHFRGVSEVLQKKIASEIS